MDIFGSMRPSGHVAQDSQEKYVDSINSQRNRTSKLHGRRAELLQFIQYCIEIFHSQTAVSSINMAILIAHVRFDKFYVLPA